MTEARIWLNQPQRWSTATEDALVLRTDPRTDFWRRTHYGFIRDSGHFQGTLIHGDFRASVRIHGAYREQYDQAGLMVRLNDTTWMKCGIELVDGVQWASVVVTREFSDWSCVPLPHAPEEFWLQIERTGATVKVSYGQPAAPQLLRLTHLSDAPLRVGPMAASPEGSGFDVTFSKLTITRR